MLTYLCKPRPWATKIVAMKHNAKAFDVHFILNRAILLKLKPERITKRPKFISMKVEYLIFLDSLSFVRVHCANCPSIWCAGHQILVPHYFNTEQNLDYVSPMIDITYYFVYEMSGSERKNSLRGTRSRSRNPSTIGAC